MISGPVWTTADKMKSRPELWGSRVVFMPLPSSNAASVWLTVPSLPSPLASTVLLILATSVSAAASEGTNSRLSQHFTEQEAGPEKMMRHGQGPKTRNFEKQLGNPHGRACLLFPWFRNKDFPSLLPRWWPLNWKNQASLSSCTI